MKIKRFFLFILISFLSLMIGSMLGRMAGLTLEANSQIYQYVSKGWTLTLPLFLDLQVLVLELNLSLIINALGILGLLLGAIIFFKLKL